MPSGLGRFNLVSPQTGVHFGGLGYTAEAIRAAYPVLKPRPTPGERGASPL